MRKLNTLPSANMRKLPKCTRLPKPVPNIASVNVHVHVQLLLDPTVNQRRTTETLPELPQEPEIGKFYMYKGRKVQCVASENCDECVNSCDGILCSASFYGDRTSIKLISAD